MPPSLLERQAELRALTAAVDLAAGGHGSTALVTGEAGIGKTSLVNAFLATLPAGLRVLAGACEDLLTPRALGPLRDAARSVPGPLRDALGVDADPNLLLPAISDQLATSPRPTVFVVEDAHWADGATLDVLRYLGRRMETLPALLVITYRDDETSDHPLRGVLGSLVGPATLRLRLPRLTLDAVHELADASRHDPTQLHRLTAGNPFFVSEVLATPDDVVPPTVLDAVLARVRKLSPAAQDALERIAVVPSGVELELLRAMLADRRPVSEAERAGVLALRGDVVAFRHELARRAVVESMPAMLRVERNAEVMRLLLAGAVRDPFRVLHHAMQAGDDEVVVTYGRQAAREASRLGAYRQAASAYAAVLDRGALLPLERRAALREAYGWALVNSNQLYAAADAARAAVAEFRGAGQTGPLVRALVALSRQLWLTERMADARAAAEEALRLAAADQHSRAYAIARLNMGGLLVLVDNEIDGLPHLTAALELAEQLDEQDIAALSRNYRGSARLQLGDLGGREELLRSVAMAHETGNHEYVLRGYYNLVEGMWRLGDYRAAIGYVEQAEAYARDRDFPVHGYMCQARRCRLLAIRGRFAQAAAGLRNLLDAQDDPGMIGRETVPTLARIFVRRGRPEAEAALDLADQHARRADVLEWLVPTGLAWLEYAWLHGDPQLAGDYPALLLERTDRPGTAWWRGELLRYLRRLGHEVEPFPDCAPAYALGIAGNWRAAADAFRAADNPYEAALELLDSGDVDATRAAITSLDELAADPAAALARRRLRDLGVQRVPRRPQPGRVVNPGGLTDRQVEILRLVASGLSNADIAQRLVVSKRTVDHHVAAILARLGVRSRHEAAAVLVALDRR